MSFDPLDFKQHFPLFQDKAFQNLVYLDNGATTQTPQAVLDGIHYIYTHANANAHRSSHILSRYATNALEDTRALLAQSIGAETEEIIFCKGATEGFNLLAHSLEHFFEPGQEIILSTAEHHANLLPWLALAKRKQLIIRYIPDTQGKPDLTYLPELLNERTALLCLTLVSNVLGCRLPIETYTPLLKTQNALLVLDASQALAHEILNVQQLQCDFLLASAHKCYGPFGVGFVYGRKEWLETMPPWQLGGEMVETISPDSIIYSPSPHKFEAGTLAIASIYGFGAGLQFLQQFDQKALAAHEQLLTRQLHDGLANRPEIRCLSQPDHSQSITTFTINEHSTASLYDLAQFLDEHTIAVRVGAHCAQPLYQHLGVSGGLRLSVAGYNTTQDCEQTLQIIHKWFDTFHASNSDLAPAPDLSQHKKYLTDLATLKAHFETSFKGQQAYKQLMTAGLLIEPQEALRLDIYRVQGCQSKTWLFHEVHKDQHFFMIDSESRLIRGLGALLLIWFQGQTAETIINTDWQADCDQKGFQNFLSASKREGFQALVLKAQKAVQDSLKKG